MIAKYHIEYSASNHKASPALHYQTDDPVAVETFLCDLLRDGARIREIRHEGVALPRHDFDRMVKTAADLLASRHLCASLDIKPEEEHWRFGFTA